MHEIFLSITVLIFKKTDVSSGLNKSVLKRLFEIVYTFKI